MANEMTSEAARIALETAKTKHAKIGEELVAAELAYERTSTDAAWTTVEQVQARARRAALDMKGAEQRLEDAVAREKQQERDGKIARLDELRRTTSIASFRKALAPYVAAYIDAERALAKVLGDVARLVDQADAERGEALALARDLGFDPDVGVAYAKRAQLEIALAPSRVALVIPPPAPADLAERAAHAERFLDCSNGDRAGWSPADRLAATIDGTHAEKLRAKADVEQRATRVLQKRYELEQLTKQLDPFIADQAKAKLKQLDEGVDPVLITPVGDRAARVYAIPAGSPGGPRSAA